MRPEFDHERLDVYEVSLEYNARAHALARQLGATHRIARDQLLRAALSIPLNIAKGCGIRPARDRRKFDEIARGSATESAATCDVVRVTGACPEQDIQECKLLMHRIVSMLTRMIDANTSQSREVPDDYSSIP